MIDFSHLDALELHLSNERIRLNKANSQKESNMRRVFVAQLEKEIAQERKFLGLPEPDHVSDDELLAELGL